jgi:O-methyltransferase
MVKLPLRKISSFIFSKPSRLLSEINSNALMIEWSGKNDTKNIFNNRFELYEFINSTLTSKEKIDYLEFGVFEGASILTWAELNKDDSSRFFGFDSFSGLPETWDTISRPKGSGTFDTKGHIPETSDKRIRFIKGFFQDSLPTFLENFTTENRIIVHYDADLYSSTLYCLTMLDRILPSGTILLFDEFHSSSHEFQAFYDYTRSYGRKVKVLGAVLKNPYCQIAMIID